MKFASGEIVKSINVRNASGQNIGVILRFCRISDANKMLEWINKMRSDALWLGNWKKETLASERKYIQKMLKEMRERKGFHLVAECNGRVVGGCTVHSTGFEAKKHVGIFGIGLLAEFSGLGIGYAFSKTVLEIAKKHTHLALIESTYNSLNKPSARLHEKLSFKIAGKIDGGIRAKNGKLADEIILFKKIK